MCSVPANAVPSSMHLCSNTVPATIPRNKAPPTTITSDNHLACHRCAQVVCWLESLAAERLQEAPPARFAHHEGLWRETLLTTSAAAGAMELDPDAPSRGKVRLAAGDFKGEERLAAHLWQLIRAGELDC